MEVTMYQVPSSLMSFSLAAMEVRPGKVDWRWE